MKMGKLERYLNYNIKIIILILSMLFFISCSDKEDNKINKPVKKMVNIVKKIIDKNTTLSKTVQNDGIVVHGARDEELLDAFGLAVSQVIVEDGVSVPDCPALEKTGYITKEECEEISTKYFGFYELNEDGTGNKVGDVFKSGITGSEIKIKNSDISYFDSSGNPLLDNQVEFDEVVATSSDLDFLKGLKSAIPSNKKAMLDNISKKIGFLEAIEQQEIIQTVEQAQQAQETQNNNINNSIGKIDNIQNNNVNDSTNNNENKKLREEIESKYNSALYKLDLLKSRNKKTELQLNENPNDNSLIEKYNKEREAIAILEQDIEIYLSQLEGL